jgi:DNA-binding transcriptional MerR regulator
LPSFLKRNQELGFTLEEIKQLLDLHRVVAAMAFPLRHKPGDLRAIIEIGRETSGSHQSKGPNSSRRAKASHLAVAATRRCYRHGLPSFEVSSQSR